MIKLIEVCYFPDGSTKEDSKEFSSRKALLKTVKKSIIPSLNYYELNKMNETYWNHAGVRHKFMIEEAHVGSGDGESNTP
jgi:hypothetical protein